MKLVSILLQQIHSLKLGWSWFFHMTGYTLITLRRLEITDHGIFGHLEWDTFDCVTLERHDIAIPCGTYKVTLYDSPRWGFKVPLLHGVPNREMVEIHPLNWENQSEGCIGVGEKRSGFAIENSRKKFDEMMSKWPVGEVEIRII